MKKANYQKIIKDSGEIIELYGSYEQVGIMNPPEMLSNGEIQRILKIMKKNSIKKLELII